MKCFSNATSVMLRFLEDGAEFGQPYAFWLHATITDDTALLEGMRIEEKVFLTRIIRPAWKELEKYGVNIVIYQRCDEFGNKLEPATFRRPARKGDGTKLVAAV